MSKIYRMSMSATYFFNLKADSEDDALNWCMTHDLEDVRKLTNAYEDTYNEAIEDFDEADDGLYIDLTKKTKR